MDEAEFEYIRQQVGQKVRERFADAPIERIDVLRHGDDPSVEPGELLARVIIDAPGEEEERKQAFEAFHDAHRETFHEIRRHLDTLPISVALQFTIEGEQPHGERKRPVIQLRGRGGFGEPPGFTPVMARLAAEDLETLDLLISAGIAASRAEAVRWALARIRERPAYERLRAHTREIQELKAEF
jgi:hypothetical protein